MAVFTTKLKDGKFVTQKVGSHVLLITAKGESETIWSYVTKEQTAALIFSLEQVLEEIETARQRGQVPA